MGQDRVGLRLAGQTEASVNRPTRVQHARCHARLERLDLLNGGVIEADDNDLLGHLEPADRLDNRCLDAGVVDRRVLDLDVEDRVALARPGEHLVQRRNPLARVLRPEPAAGIERLELGQRMVADCAVAVGGSIDGLVVNDDERVVPRQVHVQLNPVGAKLEPTLEGGQSVFGTVAHRAAMADHPHAPALLLETALERQAFSGCLSHTIRS